MATSVELATYTRKVTVTSGSPYTVPSNKYAEVRIMSATINASSQFAIAGSVLVATGGGTALVYPEQETTATPNLSKTMDKVFMMDQSDVATIQGGSGTVELFVKEFNRV